MDFVVIPMPSRVDAVDSRSVLLTFGDYASVRQVTAQFAPQLKPVAPTFYWLGIDAEAAA